MKISPLKAILAALLASVLHAPILAADRPTEDGASARVVARVNGVPILLKELAKAVNQYVTANRLTPDSGMTIPEIQKAALDRLISTMLVQQRAEALQLVAPDDEVTDRLEAVRAQVGNPEDFRLMLTVQNMTEADLRNQLAGQILAEKVIETEVFAKMRFTDAEVEEWYNAHRQELAGEVEIHVRHIFVGLRPDMTEEERSAAREKIDGIKKRLDAGESFEDLAVELSEDAAAASGGDLGWIPRSSVSGPFQVVAFSMADGEISDVVATDYGYHIIQVLEHRGGEVPSLEEVRPKIEDRLRDARVPEAVRTYIAGLRAEANIETFLPLGDGSS